MQLLWSSTMEITPQCTKYWWPVYPTSACIGSTRVRAAALNPAATDPSKFGVDTMALFRTRDWVFHVGSAVYLCRNTIQGLPPA